MRATCPCWKPADDCTYRETTPCSRSDSKLVLAVSASLRLAPLISGQLTYSLRLIRKGLLRFALLFVLLAVRACLSLAMLDLIEYCSV